MKKRIISMILSIVMVIGMLPVTVFAADVVASGYCGYAGGTNLTWTLYSDGELVIDGSGKMDGWVTIKNSGAVYSARPWSSYNDQIKTVNIGSNVTSIGSGAFHFCSNLMSVTIPDSVTAIGYGAFSMCTNLTSVTIPNGVTYISEETFHGCTNLTSVTIPSSVTEIENKAFAGCTSLTSITIPEGVTHIGGGSYGAFNGCGLTHITIPSSVTYISSNAFSYCDNLTRIEVDSNNTYYSSDVYGVLFDKNKQTLIQYPIGNQRLEYIIPNSVTSMNESAFFGCPSLTSITISSNVANISNSAFRECTSLSSIIIPDNVIEIDNFAFSDCTSLTSVTIPNSVTSINSGAFYGCNNLTDVYYTGSRDEWNSIVINSLNEPLFVSTIHYNWGDGSSTEEDDITYTNFGQYNGSTYNYVTDSTTGLSKKVMETVTIDGITYNVDDTCEQEPLYLPTDYLGNYYYIAYNLNESNEVSEAKIMPGIICTLEGYDPASKVVNTDYEPIIPVGENRTLPSGSFYVSDVTASSFPSDEIGSWVGDQIRIYCVGEQIFKVIHVVEDSGVITHYDDENSKVYIDDISYDILPAEKLINTIKHSLLFSKDYILYDNTLVSLSTDNKYLAVDINNTGKSYFVGSEIRFFIYDCTETADNYLHWTKPEGLIIQTSDNETISLKKYTEYDDFTECIFVADKPGIVTVSFSDDLSSTPINVTLHITEDKYQSLRADNVPTYEYDIIIDKDFYNAYVNGMYVADFSYKYNSNKTYTFNFSVYNETYAPGVVEVYDANGTIINVETIKKYSDPSSLKSVVYSGVDMIVDIRKGDTFSFRSTSASQKTEISVEVPQDGYVIVTNSCAISPACLYVNLIDYYLTGASLIDNTLKFNTDTYDWINKDLINAVFSSSVGTNPLTEIHEEFLKECGTTLAQGSVSTIFGLATDNVNLLLKTFNIDFRKILKDAGVENTFSTFQELLQKGGGPAGAALSAIFSVQKMLNFVMQTNHLINNTKTEIAWAVFPPVLNNGGVTEITSKDGITVKSEEEFPAETVLQVYRIVDYSNATQGLDINENDNYVLYDISLIRRGQEIQPEKPVTVYIPIPDGYSQSFIRVCKQAPNGDWVFVEREIYNGMIVIEVDHFCLFAIIENSKDEHSAHTISLDPNGGTINISQLLTNSSGTLESLPLATRKGYIFEGWYTDPVNGSKITTSTVFTSDTTIYAHWTKDNSSDFDYDYWHHSLMMLYNQEFDITASATDGGTITPAGTSKVKYDKNITYTITPDEGYAIADVRVDGKSVGAVSEYTIKRIKADHTISTIFVKTAWENPYTDISENAWYYEDIEFVSENGLMIGTGDNKFSPNVIVNRAMLVTVLWRLEGSPIVDSPVDFVDVPADEWYIAAVNWAAANGIVNGYGDGIFGAMNDLTHEQIMAILNRYAVYKKWSENVSGNADDSYTNSEWAENNVLWADLNGMFDGIGSDISDLTEGADRAELAAYLRRFCERFMTE